jgi:hypothetical protein
MKDINKKTLKEDAQKAFLAGCSSVIAGFITHPVDTVKIRMQVQKVDALGVKKYKNLVQGGFVLF